MYNDEEGKVGDVASKAGILLIRIVNLPAWYPTGRKKVLELTEVGMRCYSRQSA
jgi:hypothetical protein